MEYKEFVESFVSKLKTDSKDKWFANKWFASRRAVNLFITFVAFLSFIRLQINLFFYFTTDQINWDDYKFRLQLWAREEVVFKLFGILVFYQIGLWLS